MHARPSVPSGRSRQAHAASILAVACAAAILSASGTTSAQPVVVEAGWTPLRSISFDNPVSARYNPVDGLIYVGRRGAADGLYRLNAFGLAVQVAGGNDIAAICVHPDSGSVYQSEDYGGVIYRTAHGQTGREVWVSGFHSGDDDPIGMAIAPTDYAGDVLAPGQALVVDRGYSGPDEIWIWSPLTAEGEVLLHVDDGTLVDAVDVAIDDSGVFVVDTGGSAAGVIWEVGPGGALATVSTSEPIADPVGIAIDPWNGDLLVHDQAAGRLVRVDRVTGQVADVVTGFSTEYSWSGVDVAQDGRRLLVTDRSQDLIHEFGRCGEGPGFVDCDGNGNHDGCDIALGLYPDCNANGVPDPCDLDGGGSEDCNLDGIPDECPVCPPVEVVFVMDTSASMDDEAAALCGGMNAVIAELAAAGLEVEARLLGICDLPGGAYGCLEDHVVALLGAAVPGDPPAGLETLGSCPGGNEVCQEDWGLAVAMVAGAYPWRAAGESLRLVIPLSDEGPWCGDPVTELDEASIDHTIGVALEAEVVVSPITGSGSSTSVIALAQELAGATGGEHFRSSSPTLDIAAGIVQIVLNACRAATDCNGNGRPDECDIADGISQDQDGNGIPDECEAVAVPDGPRDRRAMLLGNRPNPFNPATTIVFELQAPGVAHLTIYDLDGARVRTLLAEAPLAAGRQTVGWDGRDDAGRMAPAGVYLYRLRCGGKVESGRMALVR